MNTQTKSLQNKEDFYLQDFLCKMNELKSISEVMSESDMVVIPVLSS